MSKKIISPKEKLALLPFTPTRSNHGEQSGKLIIEEYEPLPEVDLSLPGMDHHVLILNSKPPACEVMFNCAGEVNTGVWKPFDFAFVPALSDNTWLIEEPDSTCVHFIMPASELSLFLEQEEDRSASGIEMELFFNRQDEVLRGLTTLLHAELKQNFYHGTTYTESLEKALFAHLLQQYSNKPDRKENEPGFSSKRYKMVAEYIDAHLNQPISLDVLAQICHCSPHHFARVFKRDMGLPPHQYIIQRRVEVAIGLIRNAAKTGMTLSLIASQCGFTDQSHMTRHIKRETGKTPTEIKRLNQS